MDWQKDEEDMRPPIQEGSNLRELVSHPSLLTFFTPFIILQVGTAAVQYKYMALLQLGKLVGPLLNPRHALSISLSSSISLNGLPFEQLGFLVGWLNTTDQETGQPDKNISSPI